MNFALSEEQVMLQSMAKEFVSRESSMKRIRALREDEIGFSREVWKKMADLGWLGMTFPESEGGQEMGMVEMAVVMEELGAGLMPEPIASTVLLGGNALQFGGSEAQRSTWLPKLIAGEALFSLAYQEPQSRYDAFDVACEARAEGDGFVLNGEKSFVPDAAVADRIVVSARLSGARRDREGVALFLLDPKARGVTLSEVPFMDCRKRHTVKLDNVQVASADQMLGENPPDVALEKALEFATVALSAEMLGAMNEAFTLTVNYLKERQQFGVPIGSFQALKHRCADEFVQTELARSSVYYAAMCLDEDMPDAKVAVSTAKARCNDAFHLIANESIQMHGGIGMTDEHDIGFYFKRARTAEVTLGDSTFHRDRYARLKEY